MQTTNEERVMSTATTARPGAARQTAVPAQGGEAETPAAGGKRKKMLILLLVVAVAAAGAWWFLLRPSGEPVEEKPVPGEVVALEPISINLAGGHYLKIGIALQGVEGPKYGPDGSKALDITIDTLSGQEMSALAGAEQRQTVKALLVERITEAYYGKVMDVYFTEFVMQ